MDILLATTLRALMMRRNWNAYRHVLSEDTFPNTNAVTIYLILQELHGKHKRNVTEAALRTAISATVKQKARKVELNGVIDAIMEVDTDDLDAAEFAIRRYAARGYSQQAATLVLTHGDDPTFDYALPAQFMSRAHNIAQGQNEVAHASRSVGLPGDEDMVRRVVPLGFSAELDAALAGGVGCGELAFVLAPPKRGKTSYLIKAAANAVLGGEHVLYFTIEISRRKVFLRYFQCLTEMTYTEMLDHRQYVSKCRTQTEGEIYVVDYSKNALTPSMVQAEAERLIDDGVPLSYIVIDYAERMTPNEGWGRGGASSRALGDMVVDIRRVMGVLDVPGLSAWQVNRGGVDKVVFSSTDISECWEVVKHCDALYGLNQGPRELQNNVMRFKILEQRESPARPLFYLHSDMTRCIIRPLEGVEDGSDAAQASEEAVDSSVRPRTRVHGHRAIG